jgi:monoamine oxidase
LASYPDKLVDMQARLVKSREFDAVVIGAGIAGLGAARRLAEGGKNVALLEARERVGGRIYTLPAKSGELPVELGAEFIHGRPPELMELVKEAGLTPYEVEGEFRCFFNVNGHLRRRPCDHMAAFAVLEAAGDDPLSEADAVRDVTQKKVTPSGSHADLSFREYLRRRNMPPKEAASAIGYVEGFNAADAGRVSMLSLVKQQAAEDAIAGGHAYRVAAGYGRLPEHLLKKFVAGGGEFFPSTQARRITWRPGRVEVEASSGDSRSRPQVFHAKAAVITLPLGVLQAGEVVFTPAPARIFRAMEHLTMGPALRVVYELKDEFWRELPGFEKVRFMFAERAMPPTWWTTNPRRSGLFTGWVGGPKAAGLGVSELTQMGLATLSGILRRPEDEVRPFLLRASAHDWQKDPLSRGAYSYVLKGGIGASEQLAQPVEKTLFFAGEHTDTTGHWGTVHGALRSGRRAAEQALA